MIDIRQEARADIDEIAEYGVLQFGEAASVSYERGLIALMISLRAEPGMGRSEAFGNGVRSFPYKAHRIYYYFDNEKLTILRVLSCASCRPANRCRVNSEQHLPARSPNPHTP